LDANPSTRTPAITVADLRRQLSAFPDDAELFFGGLTFYRLKTRGPKLVQVEFNENVYRGADRKIAVDEFK